MNQPLLVIQNLTKKFGDHTVLNSICFQVKQGQVLVILGPSGCGKSTLLRCINGLEEIEPSGEIVFHDTNLIGKNTDWRQIRQRIGMVFQNYDLFPNMTVLQNVILGPTKVQRQTKQQSIDQAEVLLARVGLWEKRDFYPRQLSGGQKQRVAIVRALIMKPEILLFDEVTASLDPEMIREVLNVMLELAGHGHTMLIVTHEMQFAQAIADQILFIDQGELIEMTSARTFFDHPSTERAKKFLNIFHFQ